MYILASFSKEYMASLVDRINLLKPDALLIVGDLVDLSSDEIGDFLDPLKDVNSNLAPLWLLAITSIITELMD